MPAEVAMPRLGWTMEEGLLVSWIKQDGDSVQPGDVLFTVEGDKALVEVESFDAGVLYIPPDSPPIGSKVLVGALLAYILAPGEAKPAAALLAPGAEPSSTLASAPAAAASSLPAAAEPPANGRRPSISPRARRIAAELGVDWQTLKGSGRTGRIVERDIRAAAAQRSATPEVRISPVARKRAEELGVDVERLAAANPGKRLTREDVEQAAAPSAPAAPVKPAAPERRETLAPVRRLIAERMLASAQTTAPVTLTTEADATELVRLRQQLKDDAAVSGQPAPTYNDLLAKLCAQALVEHPALNARLEGDTLVYSESVHIGLAVDTERGLLVPVVRDVQAKSVRQVAQASAALIERARAGRAGPDELQGSTFTLSNLGMYDIDAFTPIINLPECAVLGLGRIVPKQVVVDAAAERVAIRHMLYLSLTFDHRLVDGAPAARFLQRLKRFVEAPYLWLAG